MPLTDKEATMGKLPALTGLGVPFVPEDELDAIVEAAVAAAHEAGADAELAPGEWRWHIESLGQAQWAMGKYAAEHAHIEEVTQTATAMIQQISEWAAEACERSELRAEFFRGHLERYALEQRAKSDGQIKTITVPSGAIKTRHNPARIEVVDEDAVIAWAKTQGGACQEDIVRVKETVNVRGLAPWAAVNDVLVGWVYATDEGDERFIENPEPSNVDAEQPYEVGEVIDDGTRVGLIGVSPVMELRVTDLWGGQVPGLGIKPENTTVTLEVK